MTLEEAIREIKAKIEVGKKEYLVWEPSDFGGVTIGLTFLGSHPQISIIGCRALSRKQKGELFDRILEEFKYVSIS